MSRSARRSALIALLALMAVVSSVQGFGLKDKLKRKVEDAVNGPKTPAGAATSTPAGGAAKDSTAADYYALTDVPLDRYIAGLNAEVVKRKEIEDRRAARKTPAQYQQCLVEVAQSDAYQKTIQEMAQLSEKDPAAGARITAKLDSLVVHHCGPNPDDPNLKRQEEDEIAAAGPVVARMTVLQMAMFRERITAYLQGGGPTAPADHDFKVPGTPGLFYVYSADEMRALHGRAATLDPLLKEVP